MNYLLDAIVNAFRLLVSFDGYIYQTLLFSLKISFISTAISFILGNFIGYILFYYKVSNNLIVKSLVSTFLSFPTVVVGLVGYCFLADKGVLGGYNLLFTPNAIIIGQTLLLTPLSIAMVLTIFNSADERIFITLKNLNINFYNSILLTINELKVLLILAIIMCFSRAISEVGVSMILGGNIYLYTRTITTAIALETSKGDISYALSLGMISIFISFTINLAVYSLGKIDKTVINFRVKY